MESTPHPHLTLAPPQALQKRPRLLPAREVGAVGGADVPDVAGLPREQQQQPGSSGRAATATSSCCCWHYSIGARCGVRRGQWRLERRHVCGGGIHAEI